MNIIIGNILSTIGSLFMVYSGYKKEKSKTIQIQIIQMPFFILGNIFLGAYVGCALLSFGLIRNILAYYGKLKSKFMMLLVAFLPVPIVMAINSYFITDTFIYYINMFPVFAHVLYTMGMGKVDDDKRYKELMLIFYLMWAIYDFSFLNVSAGIFDVMTSISCFIAIQKLKEEKSILDDTIK